jgi:protein-L-isoaspartate(D-aspartate) O-methyltransferase
MWVARGNHTPSDPDDDSFRKQRLRMVERQLRQRGIRDERVLAAMDEIPRHLFVPSHDWASAYADFPIPIGHGQTISQPYIVALMTEALHLGADDRVLEIGTGSGYQAAILSKLAKEVFTIEVIPALEHVVHHRLETMGYGNVRVQTGDGYQGLPEEAPFDGIIVTAAPPRVPPALIEQLADGGRLVIPVGELHQMLYLIRKDGERLYEEKLANVRFVPMVRGDGE